MKMVITGVLLAGLLALSIPAVAKTIAIVQPAGGSFRKGQPMTITWTKDFSVSGAPANRVLIKLFQRIGEFVTEFDLIDEVNVNLGQYVWPNVGQTKNKSVPAAANYAIYLIMKTDPATAGQSAPFEIKSRFPAAMKQINLRTINVYAPWENVIFNFGQPNPFLWDRTLIESYDTIYFYVRKPDGSNAAANQMFGTAPNAASAQGSGDLFCHSGKCGLYYINITKDTLLPSPNDQYYLDVFTVDHKYTGKSKLFYWR